MLSLNYLSHLNREISLTESKSVKFDSPININVEVRTDSDYGIDLNMCDITVETLALKQNVFGDYNILIANGEHRITYISKKGYDAVRANLK